MTDHALPAPPARDASRSSPVWRDDALALGLLLLLAALTSARTFGDAARYIRGDWPTMFLAPYAFLGEQLRAFAIPGWNPYQFSGLPFVGDPSSGWMYLPAMFIYALFPPLPATSLFIAFHILLSAAAAYTLARLTGLSPAGAFVGGVAFAFPWAIPAAAGAVLALQVTTWLPVALIGVEIARGATKHWRRLAGIALSGLAISQILAAWLGQAAYYSLLVIGGWVAWRTLVTPPPGWAVRQKVMALFGIGIGVLFCGIALNAAALLPRLAANALSNSPGGEYTGISGWADTKAGVPLAEIVRGLSGGYSITAWQYAGAAVIALALLSPFVATRWPPLAYWAIVGIAAVVLALPDPGIVGRVAFALLPRFAAIHSHLPERILMVVPLAVAMLAAASADYLAGRLAVQPRQRILAFAAAVVIAIAMAVAYRDGLVTRGALGAALAALAVAAVAITAPTRIRPALIALVLAVVIFWDPVGRVLLVGWGPSAGPQRSLAAALDDDVHGFLYQNRAAEFLKDATRDEPGRYAGYDPALLHDPAAVGDLPPQAYRSAWQGPANWLLVQNWGTWFGLEDVQGYNPIHIRRYGEYIDALNGHRQEYHETDIFPAGWDSPLLDPLNLRYVVLPADAAQRDDLADLVATMPEIYADAHVSIRQNPAAFPRAWLVHEAEQSAPEAILASLASGAKDPATSALLETAAPALAAPTDAAAERVTATRHGAGALSVAVEAQAPALLMLSEIWDPGWSATVDGAPITPLRANYIFMAIPVAEGQHAVELRYTPPLLWPGVGITLSTALVLLLAGLWLARRQRAQPSPRS